MNRTGRDIFSTSPCTTDDPAFAINEEILLANRNWDVSTDRSRSLMTDTEKHDELF